MENDLEGLQTEIIPESSESPKGRSGVTRFVIDVLETLVLSVVLFALINAVSARIRVDGYSMEPTLHSGEFVIVSKLSYGLGSPERGDIIVFHFPRDPEQEYIKRVIGLPGDEVEISGGLVSVNGQVLDEPYIAAPPVYESSWIVAEDSLFVLGDNRNNSSDSHNWGSVPNDNIVGKALFVYWPPPDWGLVRHMEPTISMP
jgi:signal peptidase I